MFEWPTHTAVTRARATSGHENGEEAGRTSLPGAASVRAGGNERILGTQGACPRPRTRSHTPPPAPVPAARTAFFASGTGSGTLATADGFRSGNPFAPA